jgi:hypothetical protein
MIVVWDDLALDDWRRLPMKDAKSVAVAVERWAQTGAGLVIAVEGEFRLLVGVYLVVLLVDGVTVHVDRVRRA